MSKLFILTFWLLIATHDIFAQNSEQQIRPRDCVVNDVSLVIADQTAGKSLIILIARLGDGETRTGLNLRRLYNAKKYLALAGIRAPETIVVAQGERVNGYGRIEIYVNGHLSDVIATSRNGDLLVGSCIGIDTRFYPNLNKEKPRSNKVKFNGRRKKRN